MSRPPRRVYTLPLPGDRVLELGRRPLIMGILNVTPDSFAESAPKLDPAAAVDWAARMEEEGADIIDVGGESTRPGADPVSAKEETSRVMPVLRALGKRARVPLSIDTYRAEVARQALDLGVSIVNDISGLQYDRSLAAIVAEAGAGLVLMHTRGRSKSMYALAEYDDVVEAVAAELGERVAAATAAGVLRERLIVDPGIGFAKRAGDSYGLLARLSELATRLERPVLVGPSRKSFMREALGGADAPDRDWGTAAAVTAAILGGAHVVRVHAVAEMVHVVRVAEEIRNAWTG